MAKKAPLYGLKNTTYTEDPDFKFHQDAIRRRLALRNNDDMFLVDVHSFFAHYLPTNITDAEIDTCVADMLSGRMSVLKRTEERLCWRSYEAGGPITYANSHGAFNPLANIVQKIMKYKPRGTRERPQFKLCPDKWLNNDPTGGRFKIDACFTENRPRRAIENRHIIIPIGLMRQRTRGSHMTVHQDILGVCHHLLSEDPRRMWIFGLTFENDVVSVWYFSRSHSVKTFAVNWVKDPRLLIKIILSFVNTDRSALGIDSMVHVGPLSADKKTFSYIYEVPQELTACASTFYKTGEIRSPAGSTRISGRMTRVWEVTQVTAADGKVEVNPGKKAILKDVWLPIGTTTEAENLDKIFDAIDAFVSARLDAEIRDELEKSPGTLREAITSNAATMERLVKQLIDNEKRFQHFDAAAKERLRVYFTDKQYRSMFLTKLHAWKGMISKGLEPSATPCPNLFREVFPPVLDDEYIGTAVPSVRTSTMDDNLSRQQMRVVYDEVCDSLCEMGTLGDVVDILCQAIDALHILYAVGWVHRDISPGNILAMKTDDSTTWQAKIADFEFARPMIDQERTVGSDPRIGTAFFMPTEILRRYYLHQRYFRGDDSKFAPLADMFGFEEPYTMADQFQLSSTDPAYSTFKRFYFITCLGQDRTLPLDANPGGVITRGSVVNHNFQHDLESIWWILLWFTTLNINWLPSFDWAHSAQVFTHDLTQYHSRYLLFTSGLEAHNPSFSETLKPELLPLFPQLLGSLRSQMVIEYTQREIFGHLEVPESYSYIHERFSQTFRLLVKLGGDWRDLRIKCNADPKEMDLPLPVEAEERPITTGSKHGRDEDEPCRVRSGAQQSNSNGNKKTKM